MSGPFKFPGTGNLTVEFWTGAEFEDTEEGEGRGWQGKGIQRSAQTNSREGSAQQDWGVGADGLSGCGWAEVVEIRLDKQPSLT